MERRQAIKKLTGVAALAFLPKKHLYDLQQNKPIHIIGLGSAGTKVMELFRSKGLGNVYSAITEPQNFHAMPDVHRIPFGHKLNKRERIIQEYYDPESVASFKLPDDVIQVFQMDHRFVLLAGLDGYTGTNMSRAIISVLNDQINNYKAVFSLPFVFEGKKTGKFAEEVIEIYGNIPQVSFFRNEIIREKYGNLGIKAAFYKVDEEMMNLYINNRWT